MKTYSLERARPTAHRSVTASLPVVHQRRPAAPLLTDVDGVLRAAINEATRDIVVLAPEYVPRAPEFSAELLELAARRGVRLRMLWSDELWQVPAARSYAVMVRRTASAPRLVRSVPTRAVLIDDRMAVICEDGQPARVERGGSTHLSLQNLVAELWERGAQAQSARAEGPTKRHKVVLQLLSEGLTDDAIARRLGVSVRTVRNDVASSMSTLGARSRFQAGVKAVQLGLL